MANIFLAFSNAICDNENKAAMPCFYETLIRELVQMGNNLLVYDHMQPCCDWGQIPSGLLTRIKDFEPTIIILCNNDFYSIHKYFDCPIVIYEVDSPKLYSNQKILANNSRRYKAVVSQITSKDILINDYGFSRKDVICIPFFTAVKAENIYQNKNISFIGSKFTHSPNSTNINKFMEEGPQSEDIEIFKKAIDSFFKYPFSSKEELAERVGIDDSGLVYKYLDPNELLWTLSDNKRIQILTCIADLGLHLYGTRNWISDILYEPNLILSFQDKKVYSLQHNQEIYNSSKLCININHLQAKEGFSWRVADIMASNGCLVAEYRPDFIKLFPSAAIPMFHNRYEAREICKKLLQDNSLRQEIVASCQYEVEKKCRFNKIWPFVEEFTGVIMSSQRAGSYESLEEDVIEDNNNNFVGTSRRKMNVLRRMKYKLYRTIWKRLERKLRGKGMI